MIQLTDWETGEPIFVDKRKLDVVRRFPASISGYGLGITELGERTKVQIGHDIFLVRETPVEIMQAQETM